MRVRLLKVMSAYSQKETCHQRESGFQKRDASPPPARGDKRAPAPDTRHPDPGGRPPGRRLRLSMHRDLKAAVKETQR